MNKHQLGFWFIGQIAALLIACWSFVGGALANKPSLILVSVIASLVAMALEPRR